MVHSPFMSALPLSAHFAMTRPSGRGAVQAATWERSVARAPPWLSSLKHTLLSLVRLTGDLIV